MSREVHVRFCESAGARFPRATRLVVGFQYRAEAESFLGELKERLCKFSLELHPTKTRLLEFGRYAATNRRRRGEGKPETFILESPTTCARCLFSTEKPSGTGGT